MLNTENGEYICNISEFKERAKIVTATQKGKNNYIDAINAFDIETSTIKTGEGTSDYEGFMYIWQFCYNNDIVVVGRTWNEFIELCNYIAAKSELISKNKKLVVWVHFLAYEYQFIRQFFEWQDLFAKDVRKPLRCTTSNNIEFRCSFFLTNKSLSKATKKSKNCVHKKLDGDEYNYTEIRYPWSKLTPKQLQYCFNDVKGLCELIIDYMENDTLDSIPMTSTAFVRRMCRVSMRKNPANKKLFKRTALNLHTYKKSKQNKRGGNTASNRLWLGDIVENVKSRDLKSSYPFQMMTKYFPVSAFSYIGNVEFKKDFYKYINNFCCLFNVTFSNIKLKRNVPIPYIPFYKCWEHAKNTRCFNGRVLESEAITITLTEIDWRILEKQYVWGGCAIWDMEISDRGELPEELKCVIMQLFYNKTVLDGVDDYEYAKSKELLNSIFGMTFTDPVHDIIDVLDGGHGEWDIERAKTDEQIQAELDKYHNGKNNFLPIIWGNWVTAHARDDFQTLIDITSENTIYGDTDSDKYIDYNGEIDAKFDKENARRAEIAIEKGAFVDYNGVRTIMGQIESERGYKRFITLGAKKYAYEYDTENGVEVHITVSGVKKSGAKWLADNGGLKAFKDGFKWETEHGASMRSIWNDSPIHNLMIEDKCIVTASNIAVVNNTYSLSLPPEMISEKKYMYYD